MVLLGPPMKSTLPEPSKKTTQGMPLTPYLADSSLVELSSTLSSSNRISENLDLVAPNTGANVLQGPHHSAQNSSTFFTLAVATLTPVSLLEGI